MYKDIQNALLMVSFFIFRLIFIKRKKFNKRNKFLGIVFSEGISGCLSENYNTQENDTEVE